MKIGHIIEAGVVINSIMLADDTDPSDFGAVPGPDGAGIGWTVDGDTWAAPVATVPDLSFADLKAAKIAAITAKASRLLGAGAPVIGGLHVALDDGSRADLTAMGSTAIGASSGAIAWPASYATGWISIENTRIALPTAAAGLALAAVVGDYYAAIIQHRRDLKDAVLAAADAAALTAIDIDAGWPA